MGFWSKLGKGILKVAPFALHAIPGIGTAASIAIQAGLGAANAKASGAGLKGTLLGAGLGAAGGKIPGLDKGLSPSAGAIAKQGVKGTLANVGKSIATGGNMAPGFMDYLKGGLDLGGQFAPGKAGSIMRGASTIANRIPSQQRKPDINTGGMRFPGYGGGSYGVGGYEDESEEQYDPSRTRVRSGGISGNSPSGSVYEDPNEVLTQSQGRQGGVAPSKSKLRQILEGAAKYGAPAVAGIYGVKKITDMVKEGNREEDEATQYARRPMHPRFDPDLSLDFASGRREAIRNQPFRSGYEIVNELDNPKTEDVDETNIGDIPPIYSGRTRRRRGQERAY